MRKTGTISNYHWVEDQNASLEDLLNEIKSKILNTRAVNTSFDSGVLGSKMMALAENEIQLGWSIINSRAVSPVITEEGLNSFLYTDSYDEWYFFKDVPANFNAIAFCNFLGLSLQRADELNFEGGCDLISALTEYKPTAVAGWNDVFSYCIIQK